MPNLPAYFHAIVACCHRIAWCRDIDLLSRTSASRHGGCRPTVACRFWRGRDASRSRSTSRLPDTASRAFWCSSIVVSREQHRCWWPRCKLLPGRSRRVLNGVPASTLARTTADAGKVRIRRRGLTHLIILVGRCEQRRPHEVPANAHLTTSHSSVTSSVAPSPLLRCPLYTRSIPARLFIRDVRAHPAPRYAGRHALPSILVSPANRPRRSVLR